VNDNRLLVIILAVLVFICLACVCCLGIAVVFYGLEQRSAASVLYQGEMDTTEIARPLPPAAATPNLPPEDVFPTPTNPAASPIPTLPLPESGSSGSITETLQVMENTIVPVNDPLNLAQRLEGKVKQPRNLEFPLATYQQGDQETFWVTDTDTSENFEVQATMEYATEHVYFWIEDGISFNQRQLERLVDTFETQIYPTNRAFFGSEWNPGVDADPRLYILYTRDMGKSIAGYFSTTDEYLPQVREYSNGHEMFVLSARYLALDEEYTYGVLAHEFQHMIHWNTDRNEEIWMNEGFSDVAMLLNNYDIGGADGYYTNDPDVQLTNWVSEYPESQSYYGGSFLFLTYFLDRFGEEATKALVARVDNGLVSIDNVLADLNAIDALSGKRINADDVFADWVVANFLQDERVSDGRYDYGIYPNAPRTNPTERIADCPSQPAEREVSQFGVDYIAFDCRKGDYSLHFEAPETVGILPANPYSGSYAYYSNKGDESDMTLTREFDFSNHTGPLTLRYWTWYDLEEDYDYLFVEASEDGENWQILTTPSGTPEDPSGNSYGWGYNGKSGNGPEWIQERLDISQFAGKKVQLRFEYVTDGAVNGEGFLLDDLAIDEIGYFTDFEQSSDGWQADGFVRIQNLLPQNFLLTIIRMGDQTTVERIYLPEGNVLDLPLSFGNGVDEIAMVVSGSTRFTRQKASYQFYLK
jgi:hypothetical protein